LAIQNDNSENVVNCLKQNIDERVQLAVVLVTTKKKDRYDAIKRICCLEKPVPSQVITTGILEDDRKRKSVITKVIIQINCKLGGEIWQSNIPVS
jgi:aubergine